ncbi:MAG: spermidine synthase [Kiritimatiellia bacterium]
MRQNAVESPSSSASVRGFLLLVVSVSGAIVMVLEILGTRVIGTQYGSSLYVWTALLSVTMVCLALGYELSGRIADRFPSARLLYLLLMCAGVAVLLAPCLTPVLVPLSRWLGLVWGAIASAFIVFFFPLTVLAMTGPYVIRLLARGVEGVGKTSGSVYAVSTLGSIAGVLLVSLVMIPSLGTRQLLYLCSMILIGLGTVGFVLSARWRAAPALLCTLLPWVLRTPEPAVPGELFHTESPFGNLRVVEKESQGRGRYRMLMVNGIMQTGMPVEIDLLGPGSLLKSDRYYLELLPYFYPDLAYGRTGILIGLAGGMFARVIEWYGVNLTAVEIDAKVVEIARAFFGYAGAVDPLSVIPSEGERLSVPRRTALSSEMTEENVHPSGFAETVRVPAGRVVIEDGRQYLVRQTNRVDFIVLDAYNSDSIPFHLITREFFELVRSRLTDDGILAINYIGRPQNDFVTESLFRTLAEVFGPERVVAYRTGKRRDEVQVLAVFAFRQPMELRPLWPVRCIAKGLNR